MEGLGFGVGGLGFIGFRVIGRGRVRARLQ